ncbi:DUF3892 domain-containing protein [Mumia sp. zg.B53]|uniref:DUF3892 domain-containing protein n=1 Tax=Mumia sp. zg.B53 TaxID=2855449 RepID=UPI001C6E1E5A|nr:DUF3892 domain-containing protein [Mumia sp. zg.B53]MBW9214769.1 DUF3892 domain-containing protein [Mumia sp. zg.B53]
MSHTVIPVATEEHSELLGSDDKELLISGVSMRYIRQISVQSPGTSNEHIVAVRYSESPAGGLRTRSRQDVVRDIDAGRFSYQSQTSVGSGARVATRHPAGRPAYIATVADGRETNNLLALPRF